MKQKTQNLETIVKKSVRSAVAAEFMKLRAFLLPFISQEEQREIEKKLGKRATGRYIRSKIIEV